MRFDQILNELTPGADYTFQTTTQIVIVRRGKEPTKEDVETVFILDDYAAIIWNDGIIKKPTLIECVARWDAIQDARTDELIDQKRTQEYGSIGDQLDMIYWDTLNDTTTWTDHITQVKADNPKGI